MNPESILIYQITEEKEKSLFNNAYVFFDTSSLLDFYYFSDNTRKEIFQKVLKPLNKRLWIAAQTEYEFLKNREKVFLKPVETYDNLKRKGKGQKDGGHVEEIDNVIKSLINTIKIDLTGQIKTLKEKTSKSDKHPYLDNLSFDELDSKTELLNKYLVKFQTYYNQFRKEIELKIDTQKNSLKGTLTKDVLLKEFQKHFQTTKNLTYSETLELLNEGELRYKNEIPPGYLDEEDKVGFQKYGDLILWKQILNKIKEDKKDVILVINDLKEDWWYYPDKENPTSPRHELIKEFFDETGQIFWMYDINSFLFKSKKFLAASIEEEVIADVKSVTQPEYFFDQTAITTWISEYFDSITSVEFLLHDYDHGIDYSFVDSLGERFGFMHKYISKSRYTGLYLPMKVAFEHSNYARANFGFNKIGLVIECPSYETGITLLKHIGRKNPKNILDLGKDYFRLIIVTKENNKLVTLFDSQKQNVS